MSVINACSLIDAEILVIDNYSTDGSKAFFKDRFKEVNFTWHTENAGFSTANNLALLQAKGNIVLFLNPDTLLPEDCLKKCLQFYTSQPNMGACGIKMVDGSGHFLKESKRGFPSPASSFFKMVGLAAIFPRSTLFARYYLGHLPNNVNHKVEVLSGAFMMVSKKVLDITGGFDEAFFMYGEDIDLSYRIEKAGFNNYYFADSSIIHFKGESTKKQTTRYIRTFYGAMKLFVKKHYLTSAAVSFTIVIEIAILIKLFIAAVKQWFKKTVNLLPKKSKSQVALNTIIVADKLDYAEMVTFLKMSASSHSIVGRLSLTMMDEDAIGNWQQLPYLITQHHIHHIIFCTDGKNIDSIILLMQQVAISVSFSFHLKGTKSIVGSNNKNSVGYFVTG